MPAKIEFIPEAAEDYRELDGSVKKKVAKRLVELSGNPMLGERLGNKFGMDLTGFFKLYVDNRKIRIVYRLIGDQVEIVEIWGIGKREKEEIYHMVAKRLEKKP